MIYRSSAVRVVWTFWTAIWKSEKLVKGSNLILRGEIGDLLHLTRELPQALGEMEQPLQEGDEDLGQFCSAAQLSVILQ